MEFEMVDIKNTKPKKGDFVMKEFEVSGKVNQTAKKREKRKKKKVKETELKSMLEEKKKMQAQA
jgi:hypothetical protein